MKFAFAFAIAFTGLVAVVAPASAQQTIIDEWATIKTPPAPALKSVTLDPKTTALLLLDFVKQSCNMQRRPRCVASVPATKEFLGEARAHQLLVVYSYVNSGSFLDTLPDLAPKGDEPAVQSGPDKFFNTDLEKILKDHGIKTVIVTGTAAHGAVLHTGDEAAIRGFNVIVPVDGMSAEDPFIELYVAYNFAHAPGVAAQSTLTRFSMIKF
ncbi:MAG: isochorismatase family protein [Alphaproteobacteria bacterium]|nr:isochorismatase family protein [Alphaproteobacteria bacterium]